MKTKTRSESAYRVSGTLDELVGPRAGDMGSFLWCGKGPRVQCQVVAVRKDSLMRIRYLHPETGLVIANAVLSPHSFLPDDCPLKDVERPNAGIETPQ